MTFKEWIIELFKDEHGSTSIKPLVALVGTIFLCGALLIDTLSNGGMAPSNSLVNAVMVITAIGMGADSLDKFTKKKSS